MPAAIDECAEKLRAERFTTKDDLLDWVSLTREHLNIKAGTDKKHSAAFYHAYDKLLEKFESRITETVFFERLEDYWYYSISVHEDGARVELEHANSAKINEDDTVTVTVDQRFLLIAVSEPLLTVEDYAAEYGVESGTVRQWIRRGKLRNVRKVGNEWRIPRITELPGRGGYENAVYMWYERLRDLPEEFAFLNNYACAMINRDYRDKTLFHITYVAQGVKATTMDCDVKERERIELFMISHPNIHYVGGPMDGLNISISRKHDSNSI